MKGAPGRPKKLTNDDPAPAGRKRLAQSVQVGRAKHGGFAKGWVNERKISHLTAVGVRVTQWSALNKCLCRYLEECGSSSSPGSESNKERIAFVMSLPPPCGMHSGPAARSKTQRN